MVISTGPLIRHQETWSCGEACRNSMTSTWASYWLPNLWVIERLGVTLTRKLRSSRSGYRPALFPSDAKIIGTIPLKFACCAASLNWPVARAKSRTTSFTNSSSSPPARLARSSIASRCLPQRPKSVKSPPPCHRPWFLSYALNCCAIRYRMLFAELSIWQLEL